MSAVRILLTAMCLCWGVQAWPGVQIRGNPRVFADGNNRVFLWCISYERPWRMDWYNKSSNAIIKKIFPMTRYSPFYIGLSFIPYWNHNNQTLVCRRHYYNGVVSLKEITLNIQYTPGVPTLSLDSPITPRQGDNVTFKCSSHPPGNPPAAYFVEKNGSIISHKGTTHISNITANEDQASFVCFARNKFTDNALQSAEVKLNVLYAPRVRVEARKEKGSNSVKLRCVADGNPQQYVFYSWSHLWNKTPIRYLNGTACGRTNELILHSVTFNDSGSYVCDVSNGIPGRSLEQKQCRHALVSVEGKPRFLHPSSGIHAHLGQNITLSWKLYSHTTKMNFIRLINHIVNHTFEETEFSTEEVEISVNVYGTTVFKPGFNVKVVLTEIDEDMFGVYSLNACNDIGCSFGNISLIASGPPLPPLDFQITKTTSNIIHVTWVSNFNGGHEQVFILRYRPENVSTDLWEEHNETDPGRGQTVQVEIIGLHPETAYVISVMSVNKKSLLPFDVATSNWKTVRGITRVLQTFPSSKPPTSFEASDKPVDLVPVTSGVTLAVVCLIAVAVIVIIWRRYPTKQEKKTASIVPNTDRPDSRITQMASRSDIEIFHDNILYVGQQEHGDIYAKVNRQKQTCQKRTVTLRDCDDGDTTRRPSKRDTKTPNTDEFQNSESEVEEVYAKPMKKQNSVYANLSPGLLEDNELNEVEHDYGNVSADI